ncbi:isoleucine--tRNA ligase [Candidatus Dependentiae bacterium]|nr:isoleucine--tRNA ligase [Candidatus Dependentiae bacterium]
MNEKEQKNPYQSTLNLPTTEFSIRANAHEKEPELLKRWKERGIVQKVVEKNKGKTKFVLHDGPPYANGHIHMGHALNKILKDIVCKSQRMIGKYVPFVVGWDCHGLPIELKVMKELETQAQENALHKSMVKQACREYASGWIAAQKEEFESLGVLSDQTTRYATMDPTYEASTVRALATFVKKGFIERKGKTVPWCASCKTVLATAEIEYQDRKDPSSYVLFPVPDELARMTFPFAFEKHKELEVNFLVWTTTPWTLPLNRALVINPTTEYVVLKEPTTNRAFIVAAQLADKICQMLTIEKQVVAEFDAVVFQDKRVYHPLIDHVTVPVLLDESILANEGTAVLHCAPGCGPDDYLLGIKNNLEIFSPVSDDGKYTFGIMPAELEGMPVADGQFWVLKALAQKGRLLHKTSLTHSYPHCWRCHNGLIFRATDQWFCDLQKNDLVSKALHELEYIEFIPAWGKQRLLSFVGNRTEWCISRQRQWGVPIPALLCGTCNWAYLDAEFIAKVADRVAHQGVEYWDWVTITDLLEEGLLKPDFACASCGNNDVSSFVKEEDILDVWFDSGASSYAVLAQDSNMLGFPADLYLEGSDQHRGWFQSSLLCAMVIEGKAPYKALLTHGFVVDEKKHKMSKSVGNVVAPNEVIKQYSRDILRLWVASADYQDDIVISEKVLKNMAEVYRKIRNTCRFLISNLYDFDASKDLVALESLLSLDQFALAQLHELNAKVQDAYAQYHFSSIVQLVNNYCANDLSAVYLDVIKDRLYCEKADGHPRRSAQTVMYHMLQVLVRLLAPIMSFTAEEIADHVGLDQDSVHLTDFAPCRDIWEELRPVDHLRVPLGQSRVESTVKMQGFWIMLHELRAAVLKAIEPLREQGVVKHSLEAKVTIHVTKIEGIRDLFNEFVQEHKSLEDVNKFFKDWLIVSHVEFVSSLGDCQSTDLNWLSLKVEHADGVKCPRCWHWCISTHDKQLCKRCELVLK